MVGGSRPSYCSAGSLLVYLQFTPKPHHRIDGGIGTGSHGSFNSFQKVKHRSFVDHPLGAQRSRYFALIRPGSQGSERLPISF